MTDLVPMLLGDPSELEATLLQSADDDEPGGDSLARVGAALGISAGALAAVSAGSTLAAPAATVAGKAVALSKPLTFASLAKWLAVGIGAGMATGGVAQVASRAMDPVPPPTLVAAPLETKPQVAPPLGAPGVAETASPTPEPTPPSTAAPPANTATFAPLPAATAATEPAPTAAPVHTGSASFEAPETNRSADSPTSTLGDETKALDGARHSLATGNAGAALGALDAYRAKWPRGALRAEAALLRVDALLRLGNRPAAEREANALIHAAPTSRYATRARALLGIAE